MQKVKIKKGIRLPMFLGFGTEKIVYDPVKTGVNGYERIWYFPFGKLIVATIYNPRVPMSNLEVNTADNT